MSNPIGKIVIIVGPNASGKSNLGVFLAKKLKGEIISVDSRQVYKGLDVGSGKITKKEMGNIPHYCLDIANPKKVFTAYDYAKCARQAIEKIWKKEKIPIIVGGTGFYIDAAIGRVILSNVPPNPKLRKKLFNYSTIQLFNLLQKLDLKRAKSIDKKNRVRLIRAIEIIKNTKHKSQNTNKSQTPKAQIIWIGIKKTPIELKKRIHKRLVARLQGIIKEIKTLKKNGLSWKRFFDLGLEYRYVSLYLRNKLPKKEMVKKLESEINKYSKRQMTYFKKNKEIKWISKKEEIDELLK